jgi:hypothetical protein
MDGIKALPIILITTLISAMFAVALVPTLITQWQGVDTSSWNFTGHEGAAVLWGLAPFLLIAGIVLAFMLGLIVWKSGKKG